MGHLLSVCLCSCHLHLLVSVSTLLFLYIDTAISTTIGIAVVHVVDESLKAIVEEASNTSVPQSQGLPSGQRNRFLVRACQVTGTVLDSDIGWNVTQPGADISDCVFTGETRSPILLTVPLEFLRNVSTDNDPNLFPTALRNFSIDPQQSPLRVILADEAKNQEGQDENDALKQRCPVQCVYQSNITNAVKTTAIEHAEPTKMAHPFVTLEEEAMSQRKQTGIPFPETLKVLVIKHTVDQPLLGETKGPASLVTRLNTSRGKEEEKRSIVLCRNRRDVLQAKVLVCQVTGTTLDTSIGWSVTRPIADVSHWPFTNKTATPRPLPKSDQPSASVSPPPSVSGTTLDTEADLATAEVLGLSESKVGGPVAQSSKKELMLRKGNLSTVGKNDTQTERSELSVTGDVPGRLGCDCLLVSSELTCMELFEFPKYEEGSTSTVATVGANTKVPLEQPQRQHVSESLSPVTDIDSARTETRQTSTKKIEIRVLGSKFYNRVLESYVVLNMEGSPINIQQGICNELTHWSFPQVVNVREGEDMTTRMTIEDKSWSVKPEQKRELVLPHTSTYISFGIISPEPREVLGLCFVKPAHHDDPIEIPFYPPPHMARVLSLPQSPSDDQGVVSRIIIFSL